MAKVTQKGVLWRYAIMFSTLHGDVNQYMLHMQYHSFRKVKNNGTFSNSLLILVKQRKSLMGR